MSQPLQHYEPEIHVTAAGREWTLRRHSDFDSLWEGMVADGRADADEHIPYWTELWPSSLVLSEWLARNRARVAGHRCLDLGCGIGLTALAGQWLGAEVMGIDYEAEALHYAKINAALNNVPSPAWVAMDWRRPAVAPGTFDLVWGGDIMYERRFVEPVLAVCGHALARGGKVWVAEPGRSVYEYFLRALPSFGWQGRKVFDEPVDALYAQAVKVRVAIWELERLPDRGGRS
ncbi:MAG: methyltransferase domain-containing protein [Desulfovibrionaceae bacterium]|nr:methyltransferase domain-containing protein [Desulfovibrionaceae bacterium]